MNKNSSRCITRPKITKENRNSEILCTCAVWAEVDVSAPDTTGGNEGTTCVF